MLKNNKNVNKLINYTCFINPIFLFGTVNSIYLNNTYLTIIIYLSNILSNIIIGISIRNEINYKNSSIKENKSIINIYFDSLKKSINSIINIFCNIMFFSFIICILKEININNLFYGIFEFSYGIYIVSLRSNTFLKGLIISSIINFSSLSIHFQILNINRKIKYTKFLKYRIISVFIGIIIYITLYNLIIL